MKKIAIFVILLSVCIYGCATTGNKETAQNTENKETVQNNCVPNFTEEGGFWEGKTFKSFKDFSNISKGQAFDKAIAAVVANGLQISTSNKETGLISASTGIAFGQGSRAPFNALIRDIGKRTTRVEISYNIGPGSIAPTSAIIENFCKFYNAISPDTPKTKKLTQKQSSDTKENSSLTYLTVKKTTKIRSTNDAKSKIIATLNSGEEIEKLGESGSWYKIRTKNGQIGWTLKSSVMVAE